MADLTERLRESEVDFETAVAYVLSPEMRRLIILYVAGVIVTPFGLSLFFRPGVFGSVLLAVIVRLVGLTVAVAGATLLFAGLVGAAFKVVADGNNIAAGE